MEDSLAPHPRLDTQSCGLVLGWWQNKAFVSKEKSTEDLSTLHMLPSQGWCLGLCMVSLEDSVP